MQGNTESDYLLFVEDKAIAVVEAKKESNPLGKEMKDKQIMWNVLQVYIHKHPELFTMASGVLLGWVDENFYKNVSEEVIKAIGHI